MEFMSAVRCLIDWNPSESEVSEVDKNLIADGTNGAGGEKLEVLRKMLDGILLRFVILGKMEVYSVKKLALIMCRKEACAAWLWLPRCRTKYFRFASLDGDADQLVYFSVPSKSCNKFDLVDGDKILSLFAIFTMEQLNTHNKVGDENTDSVCHARLGVVQTANANGASTDYLKNLGLEVVFTPPGVKYFHEKAAEYDIGIYFEANGHGTILLESFSCWLEARCREFSSVSKDVGPHKATLRLLAVSKLITKQLETL